MPHLTDTEIASYREARLPTVEAYLEADAHLSHCPECRSRVIHPQSPVPAALSAIREAAAHPDEEQLLRLAREEDAVPVGVRRHVSACPECREDIVALTATLAELTPDLWEEAGRVLQGSPARRPVPPGERLAEAAQGWLKQFADGITAALEPLRDPARPAVRFAFKTEETVPKQPLKFADPAARGLATAEGERLRLHIEHTEWRPGTLILLVAEAPAGAAPWRRFAMLRAGWKTRAADVRASVGELDSRTLCLGRVDPALLPDALVEDLRRSYQAASTDDPASLPVWRSWATEAQALRLAPGVRRLLEEIAQPEAG